MLSSAGLFIRLILLIWFALRGWHLLIAAPLSALVVALCGELPIIPMPTSVSTNTFVEIYLQGFGGFSLNTNISPK